MRGVEHEDVTPEAFEAVVETEFTLPLADGGTYAVALASCTRLTAPPGAPRAEPFTLLFDGPPGPHLPQGTFTFTHATLGDVTIFVVPLGPGPDGRHRYEAVFN